MSKPKKKENDRLTAQRKRRQKQRRDEALAASLSVEATQLPLEQLGVDSFADDPGLHFLLPGLPPDEPTLEEMTRRYQENIRNSPLWQEMLQQFGPQRAEALLRQCRAELR